MNETLTVRNHREKLFMKVPEITIYFWIVKLLTTAFGEALSDYMVTNMNPYLAVIIGAVGFAVALLLQFLTRKYIARVYWFLVAMVAVFGTMCADVIHIVLGVPYSLSTIAFAIFLALVFIIWHKVEGTLSIHSIYTHRRELFYWLAVLATFAMGTATGDMTAVTLHLGYLASGILFAVLFVLPWLSQYLFGLNEVFAFWFAYIMTRPLGASLADWLGVPKNVGGLGYGRGSVSALLAALIIIFVVYLTATKKDVQLRPLL